MTEPVVYPHNREDNTGENHRIFAKASDEEPSKTVQFATTSEKEPLPTPSMSDGERGGASRCRLICDGERSRSAENARTRKIRRSHDVELDLTATFPLATATT
ncbi:hypothetical protein L484_014938 [Morus notabilis]|uniref:Uncharacterized protein n=1 Tax=Morus notabilis TaxID=981085 RepID=W9RMI4_9ROSA|nr:hypothetical protein L484_014938 [Morus notabilis]